MGIEPTSETWELRRKSNKDDCARQQKTIDMANTIDNVNC